MHVAIDNIIKTIVWKYKAPLSFNSIHIFGPFIISDRRETTYLRWRIWEQFLEYSRQWKSPLQIRLFLRTECRYILGCCRMPNCLLQILHFPSQQDRSRLIVCTLYTLYSCRNYLKRLAWMIRTLTEFNKHCFTRQVVRVLYGFNITSIWGLWTDYFCFKRIPVRMWVRDLWSIVCLVHKVIGVENNNSVRKRTT